MILCVIFFFNQSDMIKRIKTLTHNIFILIYYYNFYYLNINCKSRILQTHKLGKGK